MNLLDLVQIAVSAAIAGSAAYAGVKAGLAEVKQIALDAQAGVARAHERIDELLLRRNP